MSRCFPFPPPGYADKWPYRKAVVELNKPQKEKEEAKHRRKENKRKENKSLREVDEHKDKKIHKSITHEKSTKLKDDKKYSQVGHRAGLNARFALKKVDESNSDITEEHEQPTVSSACYFSGGSKKRQRPDSPEKGSNKRQNWGSSDYASESKRMSFRIKLPVRNQSEAESSSSRQDINNSPSPVPDVSTLKSPAHDAALQKKVEPEKLNLKPILELPAAARETVIRADKKTSSPWKRAESAYKALFENWVPEPIHVSLPEDDDDLDWLMGSRGKQLDKQDSQIRKASIETSSWRDSSLWPRARHLHEVDIWALPFTVPF